MPQSSAKSRPSHPFISRDWLFGLLLAAGVFLAYGPAWNGTPIWDDAGHLTASQLYPMSGLEQIWVHPGATQQYYPLVHSVFWVGYHLWGYAPIGYHLLNILLHLLSALLLVKILRLLKIPGAWAAAAIFALHPIEVESVAWISELKNALSGLFFFATALAWLKFDENRTWKRHAVTLLLFFLGLMSKTAIAPLPIVLAAMLWWKRGKLSFKRDLLPLLPLLVLGAAAGLFTSWMEHTYIIGGQANEFNFSFIGRCLIAGHSFWFYLGKIFFPLNLLFIYPRWQIDTASLEQYIYPACALALGIGLWIFRRNRAPFAAFLYYAGMLFPAMGFINVYPFRFSLVADHFQYLAGVGPIVLATAAAARFLPEKRIVRSALAGAVIAALAALTWNQSHIYADEDTVYEATLRGNPTCWLAHYNLGLLLQNKGLNADAIDHYRQTISAKPDYMPAYVNIGKLLAMTGANDEAITLLTRAIAFDSNSAPIRVNLGIALLRKGMGGEAIEQFQQALRIDPRSVSAHHELGNALQQTGRVSECIEQYQEALAIDPNYLGSYVNLGMALQQLNRFDEAAKPLQTALELSPALPEANWAYGLLLTKTGQPGAAIGYLQRAQAAQPRNLNIILALRDAFAKSGDAASAIAIDEQLLQFAAASGHPDLAAQVEADLERERKGTPR